MFIFPKNYRSCLIFVGLGLSGSATLLGSPARAAADEARIACPSTVKDWPSVAAFADSRLQAATAAVTTFLPAEGDAQIVFRSGDPDAAEKGEAVPNIFRVFEIQTPVTDPKRPAIAKLAITSVQPAVDDRVEGFRKNDSKVLAVGIPANSSFWWSERYFVVAGCSGGHLASWGLVTARVSNLSFTTLLCILAGLSCYLLAMEAVRRSRKRERDDPLAKKYPAFFSAREIGPGDFINPIHLTADVFNKASVQKLQVILFSFLVGSLVLSLVLRTGSLTDLSLTVVALLGISGIGAATARITYQQKTRLSFANWAWLQRLGVFANTDTDREPESPRWRDLVLTNREFDIYKLQTIIFSFIVAVAMVVAGASHLSTFAIPQALLGILGLSQVVYVGGILSRPPSEQDLDKAIDNLIVARNVVFRARALRTDLDLTVQDSPNRTLMSEGRLPPGQTEPAVSAVRQFDTLAQQVAVMIESTLEIDIDDAKLGKLKSAIDPARPAPPEEKVPAPAQGDPAASKQVAAPAQVATPAPDTASAQVAASASGARKAKDAAKSAKGDGAGS